MQKSRRDANTANLRPCAWPAVEGWGEQVSYSFGGQWQQVDPTQWQEREKVTVKLGLSTGERRRKVEALTFIISSSRKN